MRHGRSAASPRDAAGLGHWSRSVAGYASVTATPTPNPSPQGSDGSDRRGNSVVPHWIRFSFWVRFGGRVSTARRLALDPGEYNRAKPYAIALPCGGGLGGGSVVSRDASANCYPHPQPLPTRGSVRHDRRHCRTPARSTRSRTLNIRGERSVTCRGEFDRHPSLGPLPPGAPPVCEFFRQLPDALERAAELDATYGRNPDLEKMPMYGVVFSFKDPFDTKDMRSTGGGDARYDIDFPGARSRAGRAAAQQGRDHLRQGGEHRIQRARRRSGRPPQARQGAAVDARLSAQHLGRQSVQSLRHHALGLARLELGLGAVGQRQPGDGEPRRGDARVLPRARPTTTRWR